MNSFTDSEVNQYFNNDLSTEALQTLIDDLESDFDTAISSRFDVSLSQESSLSNTPTFFKEIITSAIKNLFTIRNNNAVVDFNINGLDTSGSGSGLTGDEIIIEIGHNPNCTWYVKISISKS